MGSVTKWPNVHAAEELPFCEVGRPIIGRRCEPTKQKKSAEYLSEVPALDEVPGHIGRHSAIQAGAYVMPRHAGGFHSVNRVYVQDRNRAKSRTAVRDHRKTNHKTSHKQQGEHTKVLLKQCI